MRNCFPWIVLAALLSLAGCMDPATSPGDEGLTDLDSFTSDVPRRSADSLQTEAPPDLSQAHLDFSFADYLQHSPVEDNTLSAPFDLQQSLSMTALGATGTTLDAFTNAAKFDFSNPATYAGVSIWEQQVDALASVERQRMLWGQQRYRFAEDFLQAQAELFGPVMTGVDFKDDYSLASITITNTLALTLTELSNHTRLVSAQTTTLAAEWPADANPETLTGRFGEQSTQRWVDMVHMSGTFKVAEGEHYRAVEIQFAEPGLTLVMITPAAGEFVTIRDSLNTTFWNELRDNLTPVETTVFVPQFALEREVSSSETPDLGVALFGSAANFTPINNAGFLFLEPLHQHISLAIDGQGLSAATTTAVMHTATDDEPEYLLGWEDGNYYGVFISLPTLPYQQSCFYRPDQLPFLFAIYAADTGTLLHLGQVRTLSGPAVEADWTVPYYAACGDSPLVDVYQYKGSVQCDFNSGTPLAEMGQILTNAGIEVLASYESNDGLIRAAVCGGSDGVINVFSIHASQLPQAESLGFSALSSLSTPQ